MNWLFVTTWFIVEKFKLIRIWLVLRGFVMKYSQTYCRQVSRFDKVMAYKESSFASEKSFSFSNNPFLGFTLKLSCDGLLKYSDIFLPTTSMTLFDIWLYKFWTIEKYISNGCKLMFSARFPCAVVRTRGETWPAFILSNLYHCNRYSGTPSIVFLQI